MISSKIIRAKKQLCRSKNYDKVMREFLERYPFLKLIRVQEGCYVDERYNIAVVIGTMKRKYNKTWADMLCKRHVCFIYDTGIVMSPLAKIILREKNMDKINLLV